MTHTSLRAGVLALMLGTVFAVGQAQQPAPSQPYPVGNPLGRVHRSVDLHVR